MVGAKESWVWANSVATRREEKRREREREREEREYRELWRGMGGENGV